MLKNDASEIKKPTLWHAPSVMNERLPPSRPASSFYLHYLFTISRVFKYYSSQLIKFNRSYLSFHSFLRLTFSYSFYYYCSFYYFCSSRG